MASQRNRPRVNRNITSAANKVGGKKYGWMIVVGIVLVAMLWNFFGTDTTDTPEPTHSPAITQTVTPDNSPSPEPTVVSPIPEPTEVVPPVDEEE